MKNSSENKAYFFCGIGGSGMMPLAAIMAQQGFIIHGSDRGRDKGDSPEKFRELEKLGIKLFPQDGSGITKSIDALVISTAVEDSIPDVKAAKEKNVTILKRAELLAGLFNDSKTGISVAGTSGKSTVTGMIATMLVNTGHDPTVMNGGIIRNFMTPEHKGLANMRVGHSGVFVTETDESDGSIALYNPAIAVVNNITLDHKSLEELDVLFGDFVGRAGTSVLNFDDEKVRALKAAKSVSYGIKNPADVMAHKVEFLPDGVKFEALVDRKNYPVKLKLPGEHNVSNALAALGVAKVMGIDMAKAIAGLEKFKGIRRRMEIVGTKNNITVIDDFGHNPDKIAATLKTLKQFSGRLIVMFQPHGFGPLKLMGREIAQTFKEHLTGEDVLLMPEAYYAGGTADRSVTARHVTEWVGPQAHWFEKRDQIPEFIFKNAKKGDRIIIMGARDDTLSDFAREILNGV